MDPEDPFRSEKGGNFVGVHSDPQIYEGLKLKFNQDPEPRVQICIGLVRIQNTDVLYSDRTLCGSRYPFFVDKDPH